MAMTPALLALPAWWPGSSTCPFHLVTGLWCPFCGGTRATWSALHGDWRAALGWDGFALLTDALVIAVVARLLLRAVTGRSGEAVSRREAIVYAGVAAVFTVARNLPELQPVLAPLLGPPGLGA